MTKKILIALVGLSLAMLVGSADAQTEIGLRFGIRPTKAYEDRPETFSYFSHTLEPGAMKNMEHPSQLLCPSSTMNIRRP